MLVYILAIILGALLQIGVIYFLRGNFLHNFFLHDSPHHRFSIPLSLELRERAEIHCGLVYRHGAYQYPRASSRISFLE